MADKIKLILESWGGYYTVDSHDYRIQKMTGACTVWIDRCGGPKEARVGDFLREDEVKGLCNQALYDVTVVAKPK